MQVILDAFYRREPLAECCGVVPGHVHHRMFLVLYTRKPKHGFRGDLLLARIRWHRPNQLAGLRNGGVPAGSRLIGRRLP